MLFIVRLVLLVTLHIADIITLDKGLIIVAEVGSLVQALQSIKH